VGFLSATVLGSALGEEVEQGAVDLVVVGPGDGVRAAANNDQVHVVDQAGQPLARVGVGQYPVGVPCTTSTGTSILGRSSRKSVCQVVMHATAAVADAAAAMFQLDWKAWWLTRVPPNWSTL
jgi:hypothetical protein